MVNTMRYFICLLLLSCITTNKNPTEEGYRYHSEYVLEELDIEEEELDDLPEANEEEEDTGAEE